MKWIQWIVVSCFFWVESLSGQGTVQDYERAANLRKRFSNLVYKDRVDPVWEKNGNRFWYRNRLSGDAYEFIVVDGSNGSRERAFPHERLAERLGDISEQNINPVALPFKEITVDFVANTIGFEALDQSWTYNPDEDHLESISSSTPDETIDKKSDESPRERRKRQPDKRATGVRSPDGKWEIKIRNHNLILKKSGADKEFPLSFEGNRRDGYSDRIYWSPDSSKVVAFRVRKSQEHKVYLLESSPDDQVQPKLHESDYLKPGDEIEIRKPHLFDITSKKEVSTSDDLFENPWRIRGMRWAPDSSRFTFTYNQRGHQILRVVAVDANSGDARALVDERSPTFIDYAYKQYSQFIDETSELIWMSERNGWNHLYLYDSDSGKVKNQITQGPWVVRKVDHVDTSNRTILFQAGGVFRDQDPYYIHYGRINFDGSGLIWLTESDGSHKVEFSPDRQYFVDSYSRVDAAPVHELRRTKDGTRVCILERAEIRDLFKSGWQAPERFHSKGRDGETDIYGVIFRPTHFNASLKYPVIEKIYAGPHDSHVPKSFRAYHSAQYLAELGFIVVQIDGMGTSNRSKAFHDVCWRNLKDAGFPDRILWMKAAADRYPYMDLSRVGIYGGSAGGQNTLSALLHFPEFYRVGVADCGCHDNRMDKIWWNELWMGWPVGSHYEDNSNVTHASRLEGKLFLTVGELDRNVDPASTLQVVDALIKADKDFDFIMVPGAGHGVGEKPYLVRRRADFFVRHLLEIEPRSQPARETAPICVPPTDLVEDWNLNPFYRKYLNSGGLPIVASGKVNDYALREARYLIDRMLLNREDIRSALIGNKFRFTVMAHDEWTTDVPEHSDLKPKDFWDRRARGLGPTPHRPSVSCGEENLLGFPGDPYHAENILVHEFAHAIHKALKTLDPEFNRTLRDVFETAMEQGLWKDKYAANNPSEYWAECVQSYFGDNREDDHDHNHVNSRSELKEYDPAIHRLIDEVFEGNPWQYVRPSLRKFQGHLSGYDPSDAPEFTWPERLRKTPTEKPE